MGKKIAAQEEAQSKINEAFRKRASERKDEQGEDKSRVAKEHGETIGAIQQGRQELEARKAKNEQEMDRIRRQRDLFFEDDNEDGPKSPSHAAQQGSLQRTGSGGLGSSIVGMNRMDLIRALKQNMDRDEGRLAGLKKAQAAEAQDFTEDAQHDAEDIQRLVGTPEAKAMPMPFRGTREVMRAKDELLGVQVLQGVQNLKHELLIDDMTDFIDSIGNSYEDILIPDYDAEMKAIDAKTSTQLRSENMDQMRGDVRRLKEELLIAKTKEADYVLSGDPKSPRLGIDSEGGDKTLKVASPGGAAGNKNKKGLKVNPGGADYGADVDDFEMMDPSSPDGGSFGKALTASVLLGSIISQP